MEALDSYFSLYALFELIPEEDVGGSLFLGAVFHSLQVYGFFRIFTEIEYNILTNYREIQKKPALIREWQV